MGQSKWLLKKRFISFGCTLNKLLEATNWYPNFNTMLHGAEHW
jgi:hypothetical protein